MEQAKNKMADQKVVFFDLSKTSNQIMWFSIASSLLTSSAHSLNC